MLKGLPKDQAHLILCRRCSPKLGHLQFSAEGGPKTSDTLNSFMASWQVKLNKLWNGDTPGNFQCHMDFLKKVNTLSWQTSAAMEPLLSLSQILIMVPCSCGCTLWSKLSLPVLFLSIFISHVVFDPSIEAPLLLARCLSLSPEKYLPPNSFSASWHGTPLRAHHKTRQWLILPSQK